jgi:hypothetical protein
MTTPTKINTAGMPKRSATHTVIALEFCNESTQRLFPIADCLSPIADLSPLTPYRHSDAHELPGLSAIKRISRDKNHTLTALGQISTYAQNRQELYPGFAV